MARKWVYVMMKKTKIVCTLGPASSDYKTIKNMLQAGMNVARLNFSHSNYEEHRAKIEIFKQAREDLSVPAAIMLDTRGPEVRLCDFVYGNMSLYKGQHFTLRGDGSYGDTDGIGTTFPDLADWVEPGTEVFLDDGRVRMVVEEISDRDVICKVTSGGKISNRKGVNLPGMTIDVDFLSDQDKEDLLFGIELDVDYIAASFVRNADDIRTLRKFLDDNGGKLIKIVAKIENHDAIENFQEILNEADGILIARGDMGVEIEYEMLPGVQKKFLRNCCKEGKSVITATQMLESMTMECSPTRAEITDVANAVYDGTSAVMLSSESAAGKYPVQTVETMSKIVMQAEKDAESESLFQYLEVDSDEKDVSNAMGHAACTTAKDINASAIVAVTTSGHTAIMMAKYRPEKPIIAATPSLKTFHQLSLARGVYPVMTTHSDNLDVLATEAVEGGKKLGFIKDGDNIVVSAGIPLQVPGTTNIIRVISV